MALSFGVLSGLLNFIPNFGPIIAAVPPVMLTLTVDPTKALYVALFYFCYQMFDGYVLTPVVQERHKPMLVTMALTIMSAS